MKYRRFGKLDWEASILGFGVMALPCIDGDRRSIDESESIRMIRFAVDQGVNYIDSGYPYDAEQDVSRTRMLGRALQEGYRERVKITGTLPPFLINTRDDFDRCLDDRIRLLDTEKIDFYLLGGLNRENWPRLKELGVLSRAEQAMMDGRMDYLGFSFHDDFQALRTILNDYDNWSLCQFQFSYMDVKHHPGVGGIKYAADRGLAVVAAEPLRGGRLTKVPPVPVAKVWADAESQGRSPAEWGLSWVWNHPEISVVVCDMSSMAQVEDNIGFAGRAEPDSLSVQEIVLIGHVREAYNRLKPVRCTACRACMPCPVEIDVPRIFEIYNDAIIYNDMGRARDIYRMERHDLDMCTGCEICQNACAKGLDLMDYLREARQALHQQ